MKKQIRRQFSPAFKAKVALEAIKGQQTLAELAKKFEINQVVISRWKSEFLSNMDVVFEKSGKSEDLDIDSRELFAQIGQLKVENEFLKKKFQETWRVADRVRLVRSRHPKLSVRRQCELLSINRSQLYYKPVPEKPENVKMMEIMDKHLTLHPTEGVKSLVLFLVTRNYPVGPKCIRKSLMFTAVRLSAGVFNNTLEAQWCKKNVLETAIATYGKPEIFNTDQGCEYTSALWTQYLESQEISISMDVKGRALDNVWIERFWKSLKYDYIYLNPAEDGFELFEGVQNHIGYYHDKIHHTTRETPNARYHKSMQDAA